MHPFIQKHGYDIVEILPQDGSPRGYVRIEKNGRKALFMDCGPLEGIPYITRLSSFIEIADWLRGLGLRAPEIYQADIASNIAIIEDFGAVSMKAAMAAGEDRVRLYRAASDILNVIQSAKCPLNLPDFKASFMRKARQRLADWYVPAMRGRANPDGLSQSYHAMWDKIEAQIGPYEMSFMHVDFHAENLMFLPGGQGVNALGIIDFQEGMSGPKAYDLVNVLEDMRADVPLEIQNMLLAGRDENFLNWYRVLGTQFHCRLLGQCIRWAIRDNKPQYLQYMPRLSAYVRNAIDHPVLEPFKLWAAEQKLDFTDMNNLDIKKVTQIIAFEAI
jgi:aminoglycoside/choline kinase family phosphotransferase